MGREGRMGREERGRPAGASRGEGYGGQQRRTFHRKRVCRYCAESNLRIDYKDARALRPFLTEKGKIVPRRMSGACAKHQRELSTAIKRARTLAILPFATTSMESGG